MATFADQYRRWFEYEQDAHAKMLASLRAAEPAHRESSDFRKALDLAAHIAAARLMWLHRFGAAAEAPDLFTRAAAVDDVDAMFDRMHAAWSAYLSGVDDGELAREFEYRSYEGIRFRDRVGDIFTQLFGHSWYHRGQIALLLRRIGAEPAVTDFVFWTRRPA